MCVIWNTGHSWFLKRSSPHTLSHSWKRKPQEWLFYAMPHAPRPLINKSYPLLRVGSTQWSALHNVNKILGSLFPDMIPDKQSKRSIYFLSVLVYSLQLLSNTRFLFFGIGVRSWFGTKRSHVRIMLPRLAGKPCSQANLALFKT